MLKLALIGLGRWGKNIQRTLEGMRGVEVIAVEKEEEVDPTSLKLRGASGVLIATPGSTHAEIALPYIQQGLPVLIEKPMATSLKDAQRIMAATRLRPAFAKATAGRQGSGGQVFVGHIHLHNPAYVKLQSLLPKIGAIQAIHFKGLAPGPARDDMSVLWDWGPHGVSLMLDLLGKLPKSIQGFGDSSKGALHHTVMSRLHFAGGVTGTMHVSWAWPEKRVKLTVLGTKGSLILDDVADKKVTLFEGEKVSYPRHGAAMPLTQELKAFIQMIKTGEAPKTDAKSGLEVVRVLEAIDESLALDGKKVAC